MHIQSEVHARAAAAAALYLLPLAILELTVVYDDDDPAAASVVVPFFPATNVNDETSIQDINFTIRSK